MNITSYIHIAEFRYVTKHSYSKYYIDMKYEFLAPAALFRIKSWKN